LKGKKKSRVGAPRPHLLGSLWGDTLST